MPPCHRLLAALLAFTAASAPAQQPPAPVKVATVTREVVRPIRTVPGTLRARQRAAVAAVESGLVIEVGFDEGDAVKAGAILAKVDDRLLRQDLDAARSVLGVRRAQIAIETAQLRTAEEDLAAYRAAEESRKGSISTIVLRGAERDVAVATARVAVAEAEVVAAAASVERLMIRLGDTEVRAPFDGVVVSKQIEVGEWLDPGASVAELVSSGPIEAWIDVHESVSQAALAADRTEIGVRIDALDLLLQPTAVRTIPDVDPRSRRFQWIATLESTDPPLLPGMAVTAELPGDEPREMSRIPADAVLHDGTAFYVFTVVEAAGVGSIASPATIRPQIRRGGFAYVEASELPPDARVVIEGNERLRPMMPVTVIGGAAPPAVEPEASKTPEGDR